MGMVFRGWVELAGRGVVALIRERFVGHTLLDIVSLAGEDQQRLVLRFPAKPGHGAIVAAAIEMPRDAQREFRAVHAVEGCLETAVRHILHQTQAENRCGDTENDIVRCGRGYEIRLHNVATWRIRTPGD